MQGYRYGDQICRERMQLAMFQRGDGGVRSWSEPRTGQTQQRSLQISADSVEAKDRRGTERVAFHGTAVKNGSGT